jgi:hypothetical protein
MATCLDATRNVPLAHADRQSYEQATGLAGTPRMTTVAGGQNGPIAVFGQCRFLEDNRLQIAYPGMWLFRSVVGRKRVVANGGLPEVHFGVCQPAAVDFMLSAIAVTLSVVQLELRVVTPISR